MQLTSVTRFSIKKIRIALLLLCGRKWVVAIKQKLSRVACHKLTGGTCPDRVSAVIQTRKGSGMRRIGCCCRGEIWTQRARSKYGHKGLVPPYLREHRTASASARAAFEPCYNAPLMHLTASLNTLAWQNKCAIPGWKLLPADGHGDKRAISDGCKIALCLSLLSEQYWAKRENSGRLVIRVCSNPPTHLANHLIVPQDFIIAGWQKKSVKWGGVYCIVAQTARTRVTNSYLHSK